MHRHVFLCGLSEAQRSGYADGSELSLAERIGNLTLRLDAIRRRLVGVEPKRLTDLIEIASYVFAADRTTRRGTEILKNCGEKWRRNFLMVVAVREPGFWNRADVKSALTESLGFASEDTWAFDFVDNEQPPSLQNYLAVREDQIDDAGGTSIVLFSGGLDSLAGAVKELTTSNRHVVLVSHRNTPAIGAIQKKLAERLTAAYPRRVTHVWVDNHLTGKLDDREETQRTRSFFFFAMAAVAAHIEKADRIRFFENGIMSVNLPIATQVVGARASRSTHPRTLKLLQDVADLVLEHGVSVDNPFVWETKADVVHGLASSQFAPLITISHSCTRSRKGAVAFERHCGTCVQCIQRRISTLGGGATELDEAEGYSVDLFAGERDKPEDRAMAFGSVQLALDCATMNDWQFMGRFALEVSQVVQAHPVGERDEIAQRLITLFRRHGETVRSLAIDAIRAAADKFIDRSIKPGSLLALLTTPDLLSQRTAPQGMLSPATEEPPSARSAESAVHVSEGQIAIAVDSQHGRIMISGIATLAGKTMFALLSHLIELSTADREAKRAPKRYRCKLGKVLADDLGLPDAEAVAQAVRRVRKEIAEGFEALEGYRPDDAAVIENVPGSGYRLNPAVVIVSPSEFRYL
jgi:7-cyano-7-deazaguanine synthase in queuosine biosynthesis